MFQTDKILILKFECSILKHWVFCMEMVLQFLIKCWEGFRTLFAQSLATIGVCKMERKELDLKAEEPKWWHILLIKY